jgi:hypothetical protein
MTIFMVMPPFNGCLFGIFQTSATIIEHCFAKVKVSGKEMCAGLPVFVFSPDGEAVIVAKTKYSGGIHAGHPPYRKKRVRRRLPKTWRGPLT